MATRLAALLSLVLGVGCSHTYFQFDVSPNELAWIENTQQALAASHTNPGALQQVVDLEGRRAMETLIAGLTVEQTEADRQYDQLAHALYLGVMSDGEDPLTALTSDTSVMAARVGQRIAQHSLQQMGLGGIAQMVGGVMDDDGTRLREMSASLTQGRIATCAEGEVVVSYNADILGHINSELASSDANYLAWRERVRAIHLVHFTCTTGGHVLIVMTRSQSRSGLQVVGWHFMSAQQWAQVEPRMRTAFDLPQ